jgi:hypothetical protein
MSRFIFVTQKIKTGPVGLFLFEKNLFHVI